MIEYIKNRIIKRKFFWKTVDGTVRSRDYYTQKGCNRHVPRTENGKISMVSTGPTLLQFLIILLEQLKNKYKNENTTQ